MDTPSPQNSLMSSDLGPALLFRIATDVSGMQSDIKHILARQEEERERATEERAAAAMREASLKGDLAAMDERVEALERAKIRLYAYATGLSVPMFLFLDWLKDKMHFLVALIVFVSFVLGGCAQEPDPSVHKDFRWQQEVVPYIIDLSCPGACVRAAESAFLKWEKRGVVFLNLAHQPPEDFDFEAPAQGTIGVTCGNLPFDDETGYADWRTHEYDRTSIHSSRITLGLCDARTADHELGHALGLDHVGARGNAMYPSLEGYGDRVTEEQLDWVNGN